MTTYKNKFYSPKIHGPNPNITTDADPIEYKGFLIYHRVKSMGDANIFDIVKDGVCIGMMAGLNGAKERIDSLKFME